MKKLRVLIASIVIFAMFTSISFARPGGGGHGGGSSGSSGGHSSSGSHTSSSHYNSNSQASSNPIGIAIICIFSIVGAKSNSITCWIKSTKKQNECKVALVNLSKHNLNWNPKKLIKM